jgi:hypothetical protein
VPVSTTAAAAAAEKMTGTEGGAHHCLSISISFSEDLGAGVGSVVLPWCTMIRTSEAVSRPQLHTQHEQWRGTTQTSCPKARAPLLPPRAATPRLSALVVAFCSTIRLSRSKRSLSVFTNMRLLRGNQRQLEAIPGNQSSYVFSNIFSNMRLLVSKSNRTISGNQWHSVALTCTYRWHSPARIEKHEDWQLDLGHQAKQVPKGASGPVGRKGGW